MLDLSDDLGGSATTPMLPVGAGDRFAKVTGPQIGQPLHRKLFMFTRPGWRAYLKQFMTLQEVSGAFGDIGLFLPLLTALAIGRVNGAPQIEFGAALFFAGVFTSSLALHFNVPIPVQPMKTIAAVAIADKFPNEQIIAAGILMGVIVGLLALTNVITHASKVVPVAIVRGIQLGVGISLMGKGFKAAYVKTTKVGGVDDIAAVAAAAVADKSSVVCAYGSPVVCLRDDSRCIPIPPATRRAPLAVASSGAEVRRAGGPVDARLRPGFRVPRPAAIAAHPAELRGGSRIPCGRAVPNPRQACRRASRVLQHRRRESSLLMVRHAPGLPRGGRFGISVRLRRAEQPGDGDPGRLQDVLRAAAGLHVRGAAADGHLPGVRAGRDACLQRAEPRRRGAQAQARRGRKRARRCAAAARDGLGLPRIQHGRRLHARLRRPRSTSNAAALQRQVGIKIAVCRGDVA
ncbi:hypothetical protein ON010_g14159 [Phytophthora cinnamomi]|nr:hypothetical protein ON010_g14159 [Phytophthora cinnamomi]